MATPAELRQARERKRSRYDVRTRHVDAQGEPLYTNHLIEEESPYLLQHAHNPVDWYPWGPAAFERAAREDKPVFLSVGYSTCHWCHVMEEESFDDTEVAEVLNRHFVAIKVDREQRPDVDEIYMAGVQLMSGQGGWPMSSFLTPEGKPFFGATYIPKPQFLGLLDRVARVWREQRERLLADADSVERGIQQQLAPSVAAELPEGLVDKATETLVAHADADYGGFGDAPKFPQEPNLLLLLERVQRDHRALAEQPLWPVVRRALDAMLQGGIYDQVGGGFHRYATDRAWQVPHFEKMLYNQGQFATVYLRAWQLCGETEYRRVAEETLDYLLREMRSPRGGFYSATDADSEGEEGRFFVWRYDELAALLDEDALKLCEVVFGATRAGNFEGANILHLPRSLDETAECLGMTRTELDRALAAIRQKLYTARNQRVPPLRDDKQISEWNGMVIAALAQAARVLDRADYCEAAVSAAEDLWHHHYHQAQGLLWRTSLGGEAAGVAQLEDYAHLMNGMLALYDTTAESRWLTRARTLLRDAQTHHWDDEAGGFFVAPAQASGPQLLRSKSLMDGATVSGNSLMLPVLLSLYERTGELDLRARAERHIAAFSGYIAQLPLAGPVFLQGLLRWERPTPGSLQYLAGGAIRVRCRDEPLADGRVRITLTLDIQPGWHIQPPEGEGEGMEATRLAIANTDDWETERVVYPTSPAAAQPPGAISGTPTIVLDARRHASEPLRLELRIQPCTERECLPVEHCEFVRHRPVYL